MLKKSVRQLLFCGIHLSSSGAVCIGPFGLGLGLAVFDTQHVPSRPRSHQSGKRF